MPVITAAEQAPVRPALWLTRLRAGFIPPPLPASSRRAFRFHMAFILLDAVFSGIKDIAPLMAVKSMGATDVQLQVPLSMAAVGLFAAIFSGAAMATRRKKPFVLVPGFGGALSAMLMACMTSAPWFLALAGVISIFDFGMRPAVPSILRIVYPDRCRSHIAGTLRQYASVFYLASTLGASYLLSLGAEHIRLVIQCELLFAGLVSAASYFCFAQLPDHGDGSEEEAVPAKHAEGEPRWPVLAPMLDRPFRRYLTCFFVFGFANLFHKGILPAFFAKDMGLGYVQATLLLQIVPSLTAFLLGGHLTAWFDRTRVWRSYSLVTLLWGIDPVMLALAPRFWPTVIAARIARGPATVGSMVICFFTGVHSFAKPGADTSRYMAALFLVNGFARLAAPMTAAFFLDHQLLTRIQILLYGGVGVLLASAMFLWSDRHPPVR